MLDLDIGSDLSRSPNWVQTLDPDARGVKRPTIITHKELIFGRGPPRGAREGCPHSDPERALKAALIEQVTHLNPM